MSRGPFLFLSRHLSFSLREQEQTGTICSYTPVQLPLLTNHGHDVHDLPCDRTWPQHQVVVQVPHVDAEARGEAQPLQQLPDDNRAQRTSGSCVTARPRLMYGFSQTSVHEGTSGNGSSVPISDQKLASLMRGSSARFRSHCFALSLQHVALLRTKLPRKSAPSSITS